MRQKLKESLKNVSAPRKCRQTEITSPAGIYRISQRASRQNVSPFFPILSFPPIPHFPLFSKTFPSVFRVHKVDLTKMSLPGPESGEKSLREKFRLQFDNFDCCDSPLQLSSHASRSLSSLLLSFLSLFQSKYFNSTNLTFSLLDCCQPRVP